MFGLFNRLKKKKPEPTIPPEALCVMVHRRSLLEGWVSLDAGTDREMAGVMTASEAFAFTPALTGSDGLIPLIPAHLEGLQMSFREALSKGVAQVVIGYILNEDCRTTQNGVVVIKTNRGLAGAGLVGAPLMVPGLNFDAPAVAMLPEENHLLLAPSNDPAALASMLDMAETLYADAPEARSLRAVTFSPGDHQLQDWAPPRDHPLALRFAAAAATTRALAASERYHCLAEKPTHLAHLAARDAESGGTLAAAWARNTSVMLPADLDRLVLVDTPDCANALVEIDFGRALELIPSAFEAIGTDVGDDENEEEEAPQFYRTRAPSFPSARLLSFLAASAAFEDAHPGCEDVEVDSATLLAKWDAGEPIKFDTVSVDELELRSASRECARLPVDALTARIDALPAADRFDFTTGQMAATAMSKMLEGDVEAFLAAALNAKPDADALIEEVAKERPPVLSSLEAQTAIATAEELQTGSWNPGPDPVKLFPLLRAPDFDETNERYLLAFSKAQGHEVTSVTTPTPHGGTLGAGFRFEIVEDHKTTRTGLNHTTVDASEEETLVRTAQLNLRAASIRGLMKVDGQEAAYVAKWDDDYASSRLLVADLFDNVNVEGERLFFAPWVTALWVVGSEDAAGIAAVIDAIETKLKTGPLATHVYAWRELLSGTPFVFRDGAPELFVPPKDHPLAARLHSLQAQVESVRSNSSSSFA